MAVFTSVSESLLRQWLEPLNLGRLLGFEGISAGIENTNYFVDTEAGRWVLTLFERLPAAQLPFYLNLMRHLAARQVPCPDPVEQPGGGCVRELAQRPAALVTRLAGRSVEQPSAAQCAQVGQLLARMHLAARDDTGRLDNPRGLAWCVQMPRLLEGFLSPAQRQCLEDELALQLSHAASEDHRRLPRSAVHADLFRDNLLFDGDTLSGVIDFYFAGIDTWIFDLAVTCNDWCIDEPHGDIDQTRLDALIHAYQTIRPLEPGERQAWPLALRRAALRFWLSRLDDLHRPREARLLAPKDPAHFERILMSRRGFVPALASVQAPGDHACR